MLVIARYGSVLFMLTDSLIQPGADDRRCKKLDHILHTENIRAQETLGCSLGGFDFRKMLAPLRSEADIGQLVDSFTE